MNEGTEQSARSEQFRTAIAGFIEARREAKLKGKDEEGDSAARYEYASWLADAARRVGQIQAVTHVLKATHPDARGSSLHVRPDSLPRHAEIGSHVLGEDFAEDVVGNAAALDVFKLLKLEVDGHRLLDWMLAGDADLRSALHPDADTAANWMAAFSDLVRSDVAPASHGAAKQLYWLVGDDPGDDGGYHLLQPLFSSSLAHAVHAEIQDARFGESNKAARQAFRAKEEHPAPYRDYRNLVARKLGGTKPQNVSQLNSERGGINYLLASLPPPGWNSEQTRPLLNLASAMERLAWEPEVRKAADELATFLLSEPPATIDTRRRRGELARELGAQLAIFAAQAQLAFPPGWTRQENCTLPLHQQVWLDPERVHLALREDPELAAEDQAFVDAWECGDWPDRVAGDFANWLNQRLRQAGLIGVGDAEYRHWARQAIVDAPWRVPLQRRAVQGGQA